MELSFPTRERGLKFYGKLTDNINLPLSFPTRERGLKLLGRTADDNI